jgi:hypothetical protein
VVAWLQNHIAALLKQKETFMHDFVGDITVNDFAVEYLEGKHQVEVKLEFTIDEEEQT